MARKRTAKKQPAGRPGSPVSTIAHLLERAHALEGVPLRDLAKYLEYPLHDPSRYKGYVGNLMQLAFGRMPDSRPEPDLDQFRIEIKTIPVSTSLSSQQPTRICKINPQEICNENEWTRSHVFRKLSTILFVPVAQSPRGPTHVGDWYARSPFVWMPSSEEMRSLEADWIKIQERYVAGTVTKSNISGVFMFAKPQAPDSSGLSSYVTADGVNRQVPPKAFYLKQRLTSAILRKTISWDSLVLRPQREPQETVVAAPDATPDF